MDKLTKKDLINIIAKMKKKDLIKIIETQVGGSNDASRIPIIFNRRKLKSNQNQNNEAMANDVIYNEVI